MEPLMTVSEVAALLRVGRSTVYALATAGKLPALKVGGVLRFDPGEIRAWLNEQHVVPRGQVLSPRAQRKMLRDQRVATAPTGEDAESSPSRTPEAPANAHGARKPKRPIEHLVDLDELAAITEARQGNPGETDRGRVRKRLARRSPGEGESE